MPIQICMLALAKESSDGIEIYFGMKNLEHDQMYQCIRERGKLSLGIRGVNKNGICYTKTGGIFIKIMLNLHIN